MLENPLRWRSRYANYAKFERHMEDSGAILYTCEIAFGQRSFEITEAGNPRHLQIRAEQEPWRYENWHKEGALNLTIQRLPADWKYVAWIDSDVHFVRTDWVQETMHLLQHYQILQMFSHAQDIGPDDEPIRTSYGYVYKRDEVPYSKPNSYYGIGYPHGVLQTHPGFCWASRRDALNQLGGLIDWGILGSGDWLMASALFGEINRALGSNYHPNYVRWCKIWEARAEKYIQQNVGTMPGLVLHRWHGKKKDRNYDTRWKLLVEQQFDPELDMKRDTNGLYVVTDRNQKIRDGLRMFAKLRKEDASEA
jgi:hypothetical protein